MANIEQLVEELGKLTVLEAADLVKKLEETGAFPPLQLLLPPVLPLVLLKLLKRRPNLTS